MEQYEVYQFVLCLIVFIMLTAIFGGFLVLYTRMNFKLIACGANDESIKTEYLKRKNKKKTALFIRVMDKAVAVLCGVVLLVVFAFSVNASINESKTTGSVPAFNVVKSDSMSYVNEYNKYTDADEVDDHIQMFDLILVRRLPEEKDLKENDIVVYEQGGIIVVHRIVAIEEPNEKHPTERHFLLHGDANEISDRFPVRYSQMRGIYSGERIPYIGSFVMFMQSPAGYLCILLLVFVMIFTPLVERRIEKKKTERLVYMGFIGADGFEAPIPDERMSMEDMADSNDIAVPAMVGVADTAIYELSADGLTDVDAPEELSDADIAEYAADELSGFALIRARAGQVKRLTFEERLAGAPETLIARYSAITSALADINGIRLIRSKESYTYRYKRFGVLRMVIRGKTLNVYLALEPKDYENTKYIFKDVSSISKYKNYPMHIRVTSNRMAKWVNELIAVIINSKQIKAGDNNA